MNLLLTIGILSAIVFNITLTSVFYNTKQEAHLREAGAVLIQDPATGRYTLDRSPERTMPIAPIAQSDKSVMDKEAVQKTLIRVCNAVYQKASVNGCANADSVTVSWAFMTEIGMNGNLSNVYGGTTNASFSCGGEGAFGRYLLTSTLPQDIANQYSYDLNGISDTDSDGGRRTYPCGYSEIVIKN